MNSILKQGDLVKYHIETSHLNNIGFVLGQSYRLIKSPLGDALALDAGQGSIFLVEPDGSLTNAADNFTLVKSPIELPVGVILTDFYKVSQNKPWPIKS